MCKCGKQHWKNGNFQVPLSPVQKCGISNQKCGISNFYLYHTFVATPPWPHSVVWYGMWKIKTHLFSSGEYGSTTKSATAAGSKTSPKYVHHHTNQHAIYIAATMQFTISSNLYLFLTNSHDDGWLKGLL